MRTTKTITKTIKQIVHGWQCDVCHKEFFESTLPSSTPEGWVSLAIHQFNNGYPQPEIVAIACTKCANNARARFIKLIK